MIGKKWIYSDSERCTLHRQSVGDCRGLVKCGLVGFSLDFVTSKSAWNYSLWTEILYSLDIPFQEAFLVDKLKFTMHIFLF